MTDKPDRSGGKPGKGGKTAAREARLAEALKANLRRRKAQSRARAEPPADDKPKKV